METLWEIKEGLEDPCGTERCLMHEKAEIALVRGGRGTVILDGEMFPAARGTFVFLSAGSLHFAASLPGEELEGTLLRFEPEDLKEVSTEQTPLVRLFSAEKKVLHLEEKTTLELEDLLAALSVPEESFGADLRRKMIFWNLLLCCGFRLSSNTSENSTPAGGDVFRKIEPLTGYIREHPEEGLSLEAVAEKFHYNKHYLCRIFKAATGISVGSFITAVRITAAAKALRLGLSVKESGERAGFRNNSNFISIFHRTLGISPGQYRQQYREKNAGI